MPRQRIRPTVRLVHWKPAEAEERVAALQSAGYTVEYAVVDPSVLRQLKTQPPAAIVIDLNRLPSHGRDVAVAVRTAKATRQVPVVFVEGKPDKVANIKKLLPDATYTTWRAIRGALKKAVASPPKNPTVPSSNLAGYSGTPLPKKLGIKKDSVLVLSGAPEDFEKTLGQLPEGVKIRRQARGRADLTIWFPKAKNDLERRVERMAQFIGEGALWIAWPKKASGIQSDLTETIVRKTGLATGLVDYKICAIDKTYSGLKFTRRKAK